MTNLRRHVARSVVFISAVTALAFGIGPGTGGIVSARTEQPRIYSRDGRYVFPVAAAQEYMSWTEIHWDGGRAVDIEAAPELSPQDEGYRRVTRAPVVAVTAGVARPADNLRGGTAVILHGDDGMQYYYAHLAERRLDTRRRVAAGEVLGRVGRTGRWTRYLEPHLHFSVAGGHHAGLAWETDVYASHWLREHFGLGWRETPADRGRRAAAAVRERERREGSAGPERDIPPSSAAVGYPAAVPRGRLFPAAGTITADFDEMAARNPDLAGIRVRPPDGGASASTHGRESSETTGVPVATPLTGEVNVIRGTVLGLRVQVTNRPADASIILSGLRSVTVRDGEIVTAGTRIATVGRDESLLYNYFLDGELVDPEPSFSPEETGLD